MITKLRTELGDNWRFLAVVGGALVLAHFALKMIGERKGVAK